MKKEEDGAKRRRRFFSDFFFFGVCPCLVDLEHVCESCGVHFITKYEMGDPLSRHDHFSIQEVEVPEWFFGKVP